MAYEVTVKEFNHKLLLSNGAYEKAQTLKISDSTNNVQLFKVIFLGKDENEALLLNIKNFKKVDNDEMFRE